MAKISDWVYLVQQESFFPASYKTDKRIFGLAAVGRNSKIGGGTYSTVGKYRIDGATLIKDVWGNYQFYTNTNINGQHKYFYDIAESNGGLDISVSTARFDATLNRWDAGSPVALNPGDFIALACQVEQNYAWPDLPGDVQNADGSVTHADGSITFPDGTVKQPDGSTSIPWTPLDPAIQPKPPTTDHDITNPDGTITHPDGTITNPDGSYVPALDVAMPNGDIKHSDGSMTLADGRIVGKDDKYNTDGSITRANGTVEHKDGSITNTDGSTTYPDGVTVPVGYEYYQNGLQISSIGRMLYTDVGSISYYEYLDTSRRDQNSTHRIYGIGKKINGDINSEDGSWNTDVNGVTTKFDKGIYYYSDGFYRDNQGLLYSNSNVLVHEDKVHIKDFSEFLNAYYPYPKVRLFKDMSYTDPSEPQQRNFRSDAFKIWGSLLKDSSFSAVVPGPHGSYNYTYFIKANDIVITVGEFTYKKDNGGWVASAKGLPDSYLTNDQMIELFGPIYPNYIELLAAYGVTFDPTPW